MRIYACGGAGINLAKHFEEYRGIEEKGFSTLDICYLDSSTSNINKVKTTPENYYILEDTNGNVKEGSGKKRKLNYADTSLRASEILQKFKPERINVVIHSFSGGTGSIIGPVITSHLLEKGHAVIVIGVGGTDSRIEVDNTLDTIKSYVGISKLRNKTVPCVYYQNKDEGRGTIDHNVYTNLILLSAYFSGDNHELDFTDLYNFLNYQEVTDYEPKLSYLELHTGKIDLGKDHNLIGVATLSDETTSTHPGFPVEYQCVGFVDPTVKEKLGVPFPIHLCIIDGIFNDVVYNLQKYKSEIKEKRGSTINRSIDINGADTTDEGLVI